ncbi:BMP family ABC transporter substrate-binding protein [Bacillus sp. DJP31]|uniref:BMP family ABC transporter substrate-binding protein n=1 Tax=Bacillus sp. DJP31 TaxID=3409789 RepID=UPI003BB6CAC0
MRQTKQLRIILLVTMIVVLAILLTILIKTKGILNDTDSVAPSEKKQITVITSDVIVDQSWGSLAFKGKVKMEEKYPVTVDLHSEINTKPLMEETITDAIDKGSMVIIGHGREFSDVFTELAPTFPEVKFVTVHGTAEHPNQAVYTFDQGNIEYFAAYAATLKTKSNTIAILDAIDNRENNIEFETGLNYYLPESTYYYSVVGSRDDGKMAVEVMDDLLKKGVDVIYSKGNAYNQNVIDHAKKNGIYVIGYIDDQSYMGKNVVLTSVLNEVPEVYVAIMKDFFSVEGIPTGKVMLTEEDKVYRLARFGSMFTEKEKNLIQTEMDKFTKGELPFKEN